MEGFLESYRVIDLTDEKGHLGGRMLGDMGADVIKIEPPGGDSSRNTGPFYHDEPHPEKSLNWFYTNANKRGITLNLKTADGCRIFKQLAQRADLVIESFRPGYMAELGLDYSSLVKIKPDIILTSITPFGQSGPYADFKVTDIVTASMGGMSYLHGDDDRAPVRISVPQACFIGSQHAAIGSVFALYKRELTGEGEWVDVSMHEAIIYTLLYFLPRWEHRKMTGVRRGSSSTNPLLAAAIKIQRVYQCKDGEVCFILIGGPRIQVKSCRGIVAWANEEGYALKLRDNNWEMWVWDKVEQSEQDMAESEISSFLLTKTKAELLEEAAKRRILLGPVSTVADLPQNPQLAFRDFWLEVFHPELNDTLTYPGPFVKVEQCPQQIHLKAPTIGEHNREIYEDELGLSNEELRLLKSQEVI